MPLFTTSKSVIECRHNGVSTINKNICLYHYTLTLHSFGWIVATIKLW